MVSSFLFFLYLVVMSFGLLCFGVAYRHRLETSRHKRWALTGVAASLGGILVVVLGATFWGWHVEPRWPLVVLWHRRLAYVAAALVVLTAATGALRLPIHRHMYRALFPAYTLTLLLAVLGYRP